MSDRPRDLPEQPSLRYLKIEAKRRLAAGEFTTLHDAQLAIAREHGRSSWAVLKQRIESLAASVPGARSDSHALDQVRWVIARFADSDQDGWTAPGGDELRERGPVPAGDQFGASLVTGIGVIEGVECVVLPLS